MFNAQHSWIGRAGALRVIAGTAVVTGIAAASGVAGAATPLTPTPVVQDTGTGTTSTSTGSADSLGNESAGVIYIAALGDAWVSSMARSLGLTGGSSCQGGGTDTLLLCSPS